MFARGGSEGAGAGAGIAVGLGGALGVCDWLRWTLAFFDHDFWSSVIMTRVLVQEPEATVWDLVPVSCSGRKEQVLKATWKGSRGTDGVPGIFIQKLRDAWKGGPRPLVTKDDQRSVVCSCRQEAMPQPGRWDHLRGASQGL